MGGHIRPAKEPRGPDLPLAAFVCFSVTVFTNGTRLISRGFFPGGFLRRLALRVLTILRASNLFSRRHSFPRGFLPVLGLRLFAKNHALITG